MGDLSKQRVFLIRHAVKVPKVNIAKQPSKHSFSIRWSLPREDDTPAKVCKTFFLDTLSISDKMVSTVYKKQTVEGVAKEKRGKHNSRPNKVVEDVKQRVRNHIIF